MYKRPIRLLCCLIVKVSTHHHESIINDPSLNIGPDVGILESFYECILYNPGFKQVGVL
jgi:hypothetical protein